MKPFFQRGTTPYPKKYSVYTPSGRLIHFGDRRYEQYCDTLGHWSHLDHHDKKRRRSYWARHKAIRRGDGSLAYTNRESPEYYSMKYLW
jgi:hypothetical protein